MGRGRILKKTQIDTPPLRRDVNDKDEDILTHSEYILASISAISTHGFASAQSRPREYAVAS